jgi:hypothetical protein
MINPAVFTTTFLAAAVEIIEMVIIGLRQQTRPASQLTPQHVR